MAVSPLDPPPESEAPLTTADGQPLVAVDGPKLVEGMVVHGRNGVTGREALHRIISVSVADDGTTAFTLDVTAPAPLRVRPLRPLVAYARPGDAISVLESSLPADFDLTPPGQGADPTPSL